uniref:Uncharacterized protein n=1 Tax=Siphoviridae sp. ctWKa2 TaxID=2825537 RepID=A0A8S5PG35_9CAUD|nr:MAG TPA: hypothetical protein [Siphoviridae sp. ctWKa2]DAR42605.1 MAG TPA: hypothetical protein [Caudoviricetes sp.]
MWGEIGGKSYDILGKLLVLPHFAARKIGFNT